MVIDKAIIGSNVIIRRNAYIGNVGGRYRIIDFVLSNMVNSGIHNIVEIHRRVSEMGFRVFLYYMYLVNELLY